MFSTHECLTPTFTCNCEQDDTAVSLDVRDHKVSDKFDVFHPTVLPDACDKSRQIHKGQLFKFATTDLQRYVVARERRFIILDGSTTKEDGRARARIQNSPLRSSNAFFYLNFVGDGISKTFNAWRNSLPTNVRMKV